MAYAMANVPAKEYWTIDNPTNDYGRIEAKGPTGAASANKLYNRSFIRLDNISVGYYLPNQWTSKWNLNRLKVYATVRYVATWAKEGKYGDPETVECPAGVYTLDVLLTL